MTTLERIRNHRALLLGVVGAALLAFIIGDFLNSGATYFGQSRENIAEIAGESVHFSEYQAAIDQIFEVYKIESGQANLGEEISQQLRTSVWESLVNEKILKSECAKIGLTVSKEELSDRIIGNNIHPIITQRRMFADQAGRFNRTALVQFLNSLDMEAENAEMHAQIQQAKNYWLFWENTVHNSLLQEKYIALLSKAVTANQLEAKANFEARQATMDVEYVMQPYYTIPDSAVSVSNAEIKNLYAKKKEQYKQEPNRNLQYVVFDVIPSALDFQDVETWITRLKSEFSVTDDVASLVNANSDVLYTGVSFSAETVPALYKDFAFSGKKDDVSEIQFQDNIYSIARIVEAGYSLPDSVKLRHIYLMDNNQERVDSIVKAIKGGADFAALARTYSVVAQTAADGGEIGWLQEDGLMKEVAEPAFKAKAKDVFTFSQGQGVQIFQVMETAKATPKVKLAILAREVTASSKTYSTLYNQAKQFVVNNNTIEKFEAAAKEEGKYIAPAFGLTKNSEKVAVLSDSRQIVRWAFDAKTKQGTISDVFECGNSFVVVALKDLNNGEYRSIQDASAELKAELVKEKKAAILIKEMKAVLANNNTLTTAAAQAKSDIQHAEGINFASHRFGAAGMEPAVIGSVSSLEVDKVSEPIKGNAGVFVVKAINKEISAATFDAVSEVMQLNMRTSYSLPYMAIELIREKSNIEDNRSIFY